MQRYNRTEPVTREEVRDLANSMGKTLLPWQIETAVGILNGDNVMILHGRRWSWRYMQEVIDAFKRERVVDKGQGMHADMFIVDETHGLGET